jgi:hypothetical protein
MENSKTLLILLKEYSRMSLLDELLKYRYDPSIFITYTDVEKLGINPRPIDRSTPLGIYAYRLSRVWDGVIDRSLPFSYRKYIVTFRASGNILNLSEYGEGQYDTDLITLMGQYGERPFFIDENSFHDFVIRNEGKDYKTSIWQVTKALARRISIISHRPQDVVWNSIWRTMGYDGVYDPGYAIIHKLEPTQAVFFSKTPCRVVDLITIG